MKHYSGLAVLTLLSFTLFGQGFFSSAGGESGFPDAVDLRTAMKSAVTASAWTARRLPEEVYTSETAGGRVLFQVRTQKDAFYLLFTNQYQGQFPLYSTGSYIIKRSLEDGRFLQAKIFLKNDPDSFVRIFPFDDRARLEIFLYGTLIYRDVVLGRSFEELLFSPFSRLVALSSTKIDWELIFPQYRSDSNPVPGMIASLREQVALLPDMDDGAMDDEGRFVYIETGQRSVAGGFNCSGFAKYVADGLYYPSHGRLMPIEPLKEKHLDYRGNSWTERYEEERDPYFGLDWIRNIATMLGPGSDPNPEAHDVRQVPHFSYIEDVGYAVRDIEALLYFLALESPGDFYLASVNADFGKNPPLRQHIHVVVLMPYLNRRGELVTAVFERNRETSVESLLERYPNEYIHLVRLRGSRDFDLAAIRP
jgi:hypothetical protein